MLCRHQLIAQNSTPTSEGLLVLGCLDTKRQLLLTFGLRNSHGQEQIKNGQMFLRGQLRGEKIIAKKIGNVLGQK